MEQVFIDQHVRNCEKTENGDVTGASLISNVELDELEDLAAANSFNEAKIRLSHIEDANEDWVTKLRVDFLHLCDVLQMVKYVGINSTIIRRCTHPKISVDETVGESLDAPTI